jgi:CheY-like chemotaxis protein
VFFIYIIILLLYIFVKRILFISHFITQDIVLFLIGGACSVVSNFTKLNELIQVLKEKEAQVQLLALLEQLGCKVTTSQSNIDILDLLTKAGRYDVIEAIKKSGVLD